VANLVLRKVSSVLAVDADPNSCFAEALGIKNVRTIVDICEEISKNIGNIPAGMTKERYIEMEIQEAIVEADGFDLLVMGRPEGPGCYCYVNNLLRGIIGKITSSYDFVVIDNAAGMEHISRRTVGDINKLVLVSDYSVTGLRAVGKIHDLAKQLGIKIGSSYLIINKVSGALSVLKEDIARTGLELAGDIPYSKDLIEWNISGKPVFEFDNKEVSDRIGDVVEKIRGVKTCR
jgi:CO dehydrogenase maturation factor